ncbi:MAG: helix-turn-helix domain-containing protein, partial [Pseudomonadota bacterium]
MSSATRLFEVLRADMKAAGLTYRALAQHIGMSESSVKRMFGENDMPLSRLAQVSEAVGTAFEDLLARAARPAPELTRLTLEQERALVSDPRLLLVAICCLSHWSVEQLLAKYALTPAEAVAALAQLDRLGLVELRPGNRYRLAVGRSFHWRREG